MSKGDRQGHDPLIKLAKLIAGWAPAQAEERVARALDNLGKRCAVAVAEDASGVLLPEVGPQCAAPVGDAGNTVSTEALASCLASLLSVWVERFGPDPQPLRRNIVFILADDQRWDTTDATHSLDGQDVMPRLGAELGGSGVEFSDAFMTTPICCPSRASILAGQYAHNTGIHSNRPPQGGAEEFDDSITLATWLAAAGYRTGFVGKYLNGYKNLWVDPEPPYIPPGWDDWHVFVQPRFFDYTLVENGASVDYGSAETDYSTDVLREKAKQFITESVQLGKPFFLHLSFEAPHLPCEPAPRHASMFASLPPWRPPSYNESDVSDKPLWVQNTPKLTPEEQADLDDIRIKQVEMLQAVDEAIGGSVEYGITGIMETLRQLGIAEDTIVVYFSDNGWQWGEHRLKKKLKPYEESIHSPLSVRYPRLAPLPRRDGSLVLKIDLAPTFLELAGVAKGTQCDGKSLVRVLDGTAPAWGTDFPTEGWPVNFTWATVREKRWKYTEYASGERELYDLQTDPYELQNAADDPANPPALRPWRPG